MLYRLSYFGAIPAVQSVLYGWDVLADRTGLEPATTRVTGGYANHCTTDPVGVLSRAEGSIKRGLARVNSRSIDAGV